MEVGDVFNKHFINAQVDIESEEEIKIVKDYEITARQLCFFLRRTDRLLINQVGIKVRKNC